MKSILFIDYCQYFSCQQQQIDRAGEVFAQDADGMAQMAEALTPTGAWLWSPEAAFITSAVYGAIISHEYEQQYPKGSQLRTDHVLPSQYVISENPYECAGFMHNRAIYYIRTNEGAVDNIKNLEENTVTNITNIYSECNSEIDRESIINTLSSDSLKAVMQSQDFEQYREKTIYQVLDEKIETDSLGAGNKQLNQ